MLEMDQVMSVDVAAGLKQAAIIVRLLSVPLFTDRAGSGAGAATGGPWTVRHPRHEKSPAP
ncbi:MAG: hypothetical protein EOP89_12685 [Lysobacteraceae bacterium]|nr:MAG: hypothetical protein EOP89_12685 [Xanthomonadaceae bacterium]